MTATKFLKWNPTTWKVIRLLIIISGLLITHFQSQTELQRDQLSEVRSVPDRIHAWPMSTVLITVRWNHLGVDFAKGGNWRKTHGVRLRSTSLTPRAMPGSQCWVVEVGQGFKKIPVWSSRTGRFWAQASNFSQSLAQWSGTRPKSFVN